MTERTEYRLGIALGVISPICSAAIAILLANEKQLATNWVLFVQCFMAFLASTLLSMWKTLGRQNQQQSDKAFKTNRYAIHVLRAVAGLLIYWFYYQSLKTGSKVDCSLLLNTAPLLVPILCVLFFKERMGWAVCFGVLCGFGGITFVMLPELSFHSLNVGYAFALASGVCFALSTIIVKSLNRTEPIATTIAYYNFHCLIALTVILCIWPQNIGFQDMKVCAFIGVAFCIKQYAITAAIKYSSATAAAVLNFLTIPFLAVYSQVMENTVMTYTTLIGCGLVALGTSAMLFPKLGKNNASAFRSSQSAHCRIR